jgi:hypothetical protein
MEEEREKFIRLRDRLSDYIEAVTNDQADKEEVVENEKTTKVPEQVPQLSKEGLEMLQKLMRIVTAQEKTPYYDEIRSLLQKAVDELEAKKS